MSKKVFAALTVLVACPMLGGCVVATSSNSSGGGGAFFFLLVPLIFVVLVASALRSGRPVRRRMSGRQERRVQAEQSTVDQRMIRAELSVLADDVLRLESEVALHEQARHDYESAVHRYRVAQAAIDQPEADTQIDLTRVQRVVDEATWAMARAKAIVQGYPPPGPPPRLQNPGLRGEPAVRMTDDDRPEYIDGPVSFQSGWFGGGGALGGLMMGSMLGGFGGWIVNKSIDVDDSDDSRGYGNGEKYGA